MKNRYLSPRHRSFLLLAFLLMLVLSSSCTDVIHVDLPAPADRIVFNGNIMISGNPIKDARQTIYINHVAAINEELPPPVSGASILVEDDLGNTFAFVEDTTMKGAYVCNHFFNTRALNYTMTAQLDSETYKSTEQLIYSPPIDSAVITTRGDESQMGMTVIHVYFTDVPNVQNQYAFYQYVDGFPSKGNGAWGTFDDRFQDGKVIDITTTIDNDKAVPGDTIGFQLCSISSTNYQFLQTLQSQSYQASPFAPAPSSVRGNVWNETNPQHYPLGYFRINYMSSLSIIYPIK